ncbi:MAG: 2-dehydropantoate 2-reductase N-terminal domain-containing protein, partial [Pseudomonadota bacterium]
MKICIYGAGAIGGYLAVGLAKSGMAEVSIIARGAHLEAIKKDGLTLLKDGTEVNARIHATSNPSEIGPVDVV